MTNIGGSPTSCGHRSSNSYKSGSTALTAFSSWMQGKSAAVHKAIYNPAPHVNRQSRPVNRLVPCHQGERRRKIKGVYTTLIDQYKVSAPVESPCRCCPACVHKSAAYHSIGVRSSSTTATSIHSAMAGSAKCPHHPQPPPPPRPVYLVV